jgi:hypothetical protein
MANDMQNADLCPKMHLNQFDYEMICHTASLNLVNMYYDDVLQQLHFKTEALQTLDSLLTGEAVTMVDVIGLFKSLEQTADTLPDYLLNPDSLCLHPLQIYWHTALKKWFFLYYPCEMPPDFRFPMSRVNQRLLLKYILFHDSAQLYQCIEASLLHTFLSDPAVLPNQWLFSQIKAEHPSDVSRDHTLTAAPVNGQAFFNRIMNRFKPAKQSAASYEFASLNRDTSQLNETQSATKRAYLVAMQTQERIALYYDDNTIGRGEDNHITVNDSTISTRHATITKRKAAYSIIDHHSKNGTYVDHARIAKLTPLKNGQSLRLGDKEFIFIC